MMETESRFFFRRHIMPISTRRFQKRVSTNNIGFDKCRRPINTAVDMAFCCQVHHRIRLVLGKHTIQCCAVANIDLLKRIARMMGHRFQRFQIARVGQFVEVDDGILGVSDNMTDNGRTDKARAAGNKDFSHKFQRIAKKYKQIIADRMCVFQIKRPSENISFRRPVSGQLNRRSHSDYYSPSAMSLPSFGLNHAGFASRFAPLHRKGRHRSTPNHRHGAV
ncbi:Uncharacterised protein [Neisseria meningitidis]|nr:Uncharacterised protein [Neisseria meningitidis]CWO82824.1 Uncharacterised protein [Neisseria meningitidis]CWO94989.1 Uncharacterised protein [Neisseria meningitidis]CWO99561.1 Uncharacterised protein [Neisseria meningitidis]CWQ35130.1 Uncharacterised protein [Neisseria meningitidis]